MRLRNEIFLHVLDWLHKYKGIRDQQHLASIIGITPNSMSRIMNGRNEPSEETLRKLNEAFGNIFNMKYLRGLVPYPMLVEDEKEPKPTEPISVDLGSSSTTMTRKSEKDIIDTAIDLIVELEQLRRQTQNELMQLAQARQSFESATAELRKIIQSSRHDYFPNLAAEDTTHQSTTTTIPQKQ